MYNDASIYNNFDGSRWLYDNLIKNEHDAGRCVACEQCETLCPQHLEIIKFLDIAHKAFTANP
jgi:predicted aldo/keto reductase-like oxidoreductase